MDVVSPPSPTRKKTSLEQNCLSFSVPWVQTYWRQSDQHKWQILCRLEFYFCKDIGGFRKTDLHAIALLKSLMPCMFHSGKTNWLLQAFFRLGKSDIIESTASEITLENTNQKERVLNCFPYPPLEVREEKEKENGTWSAESGREGGLLSERCGDFDLCENSKHAYCNQWLTTVLKYFLVSEMFSYLLHFC